MGLDVALFAAAAVLSILVGYLVHRWKFLVGLVALGVVVMIVDFSTSEPVSAGHDDRELAAIIEGFFLLTFAALVAVGITLGRMRAHRARSDPREPSP
jgi:hypothetical protein